MGRWSIFFGGKAPAREPEPAPVAGYGSDSVRPSPPLPAPAIATASPTVPDASRIATSECLRFRAAMKRFPHLAPKDASVGAFVRWFIELGEAGDYEQAELREYYEQICAMTNVSPMRPRYWGRALEAHGCRRWQTSLLVDGQRCRPVMVRVPWEPVPPPDVAIDAQGRALTANNVIPFGNKRHSNARGSQKRSRSGTKAHRADIAEAVAC